MSVMCTPRRVFQPLFTILFLLTWNDATLLASSSASSAPTAPSLQKIYEKNEPVLELYKEPNFQGDPLVLGCCSDMKVSASYSSLRMSAGITAKLWVKNSFKGVHVHVKGHIADFSEIEYFSKKANAVKSFDKNFHSIRMFGLTAQTDADIDVDADVSDDVGVVVFENDNYAGMSVSLLGPDADELEDDNGGEASVQQIDTLKTLGSMLIPKGYQVTVFASRGGVQSHMPEMVLDSDSVGLNEALSELGFDTKKHHLRVEHTCDECDHGICSGPNQCTCQKGWVGEACDVQLPDATSAVVCESSFAFVGVGVQCKVLPRIKGVAILAARSTMQVVLRNPTFGSISWHATNKMLGRQEHSFTLTPARAVHSSITMFKARIIATMLPLYQDAIRVFEVPDHTSVVRCDREQSVLGEPVQCSIEAKQKMRAIDTHVSAFHVHGQRVGRVGALAAVVSDDSEKRKKRKTKDKMMGDNVDHSTSFTFRYIITDPEVQFGEMNVTIDVRREQKTGASDDASVDLDLNSSTDSSSSADHNVVVLTSPRIKHDIPSETDYLTLARQCMFKYQFKQAIVHLSAQLKLRPPGTGEGDAANTDASHSEPGHNYTPAEYQDLRSNALSLRGQLLTLTGRFARARKDYKQLSVSTEGSKGQGFKAKLKLLQKADRMQSRGMLSHARGAWHEAINYLSQALEIAQESAKLHLLRADAAYKAQLYSYVRFDTAMVLKSSPQQKRAVLLISRALYYILDQVEASVSNLKLCLKFHPEDKNCQAEYAFIHRIYELEKQAAVLEEKGLFAEAGDTWGQLLAFEKESAQLHKRNKRKKKSYRAPLPTGKNSDKVSLSQKCARNMCTCYFRAEEWEKAADTCDKAGRYGHKADSLEDVNNIVNVHLNAAEALINLGRTQAAKAKLLHAERINSMAWRIGKLYKRMEQAEEEKKEAERRDYYGDLEVLRNATAKEIKKAYRKMSLMYHPDKNKTEGAEQMFRRVVEAYEVLSDPNLRVLYDEGENVDADDANKPFDFKFNVDPEDMENKTDDGKVKAWFENEDGDIEWTEIFVDEDEGKKTPTVDRHRYLPLLAKLSAHKLVPVKE